MVNIPHWPTVPIWKIPGKFDLTNSFRLLGALGNPQNLLPPTIHVAGTNGKGSTVAMLKSIFIQAGYSVHTYTSPHLLQFNERINLAGKPISDDQLNFFLERTKLAAEKENIQPTFFEGTTAAAFLAFAETKADILLLETGLGGRLDCTNVISSPLATIITPISFDHTEFLGKDIKQIASEKAGIIKTNVPCIIGPQTPEVYEVLLSTCEERAAPSFCYEYDYCSEKTDTGFNYLSRKYNLDLPYPSLLGDHQIRSAATVIAATMLVNKEFQITAPQIAKGLTSTNWPGRIERVLNEKTQKLTSRKDIQIYLDGAHNDSGALSLSHWASENLQGPIYLILGMTRKRNAATFCVHFKDIVQNGIAVNVESEPSSYSASILADKASKSGIKFTCADSIQDAIEIIINKSNTPSTIIITGSLFLISDFLKL